MKRILLISACLLLAACDESTPSTSNQNAKSVEENQKRLQQAIPAPRLDTSLERQNLVERLQRINSQNMSGYIYLLSYGRVVAFYPVRGKVTSLNAYLMAGESVSRPYIGDCCGPITLEQPDYDGAYGKNAEGVFFFTTEGVYVEWSGQYLFSDQPLKIAIEPLLIRNTGN